MVIWCWKLERIYWIWLGGLSQANLTETVNRDLKQKYETGDAHCRPAESGVRSESLSHFGRQKWLYIHLGWKKEQKTNKSNNHIRDTGGKKKERKRWRERRGEKELGVPQGSTPGSGTSTALEEEKKRQKKLPVIRSYPPSLQELHSIITSPIMPHLTEHYRCIMGSEGGRRGDAELHEYLIKHETTKRRSSGDEEGHQYYITAPHGSCMEETRSLYSFISFLCFREILGSLTKLQTFTEFILSPPHTAALLSGWIRKPQKKKSVLRIKEKSPQTLLCRIMHEMSQQSNSCLLLPWFPKFTQMTAVRCLIVFFFSFWQNTE